MSKTSSDPSTTSKKQPLHILASNEPSTNEAEAVLALFRQRRYAEAEVLAQMLTTRYPTHGFGWKALGAVLKQQGRQQEALEPLTRAVELMPDNAEAHFNLGNCLSDQARFADAESCYRRALNVKKDYLAAHFNLGSVLQQQERYAEAETSYLTVLGLKPELADAHRNLGIVRSEQGRSAEAESSFRTLLKLTPDDALAHTNLANILLSQQRMAEAENAYRSALQLQPSLPEAHFNLANFLFEQGRCNEAETCYRNTLDLRPDFATAHLKLGDLLLQQGHLTEAEMAFRFAVEADPNLADAWSHLGVALRGQERHAEAETYYRQALALRPDYAEAHNNLGNVLYAQNRYDEAGACYRQALALNPNFAEAHYNIGNVHKELEHYLDAEVAYRKALEVRPHYPEAHNKLGNALKEQGRMEEAAIAFENAIALKPDCIKAHFCLSAIKTYREDDSHVRTLESLADRVGGLSDDVRMRYWFTMGKVHEDLGRADASFAAYKEGNDIKCASVSWNDVAEDEITQRMKDVFSKAFFAKRYKPSHAGRAPIFIVGMPRSGTSLLEQILATHPGVHGAGELTEMLKAITAAMPDANPLKFPEAVLDFGPEDFRRVGQNYTDATWKLAPDAERITDKMPSNFHFIGMIHLMLPHAKIIHAMRDPMDSCFSCYSRLFSESNLAFSYNLETLGRYYVRYIELMRHWHAVLPEGTILDMRYEDMVADTEGQARRLLEYLDLPWDEKCLDFHKTRRPVKTASAAQVRKPIYNTSLARWEPYRAHLAPLLDIVKDYR
jgi:tetratricopeptide (TPR) repeat protein